MPLNINYKTQEKLFNSNSYNRYISLSNLDQIKNSELISTIKQNIGFEVKENLDMYDGFKNGVVVIGNYFRNILSSTVFDYLEGFKNNDSETKIVWLFFGIFIEFIKNILLSTIDFIFVFIMLLTQSPTSYSYILCYIMMILFIVGIVKVIKK